MFHPWKQGLLAVAWLGWASASLATGVDANLAPPDDLMAIKGIGPGTSAKILQARQARPFLDWRDFIDRVPGIGPGTAAKLSAQGLTVGGRPLELAPGARPSPTGRAAPTSTAPATDWQRMVPRPLESAR